MLKVRQVPAGNTESGDGVFENTLRPRCAHDRSWTNVVSVDSRGKHRRKVYKILHTASAKSHHFHPLFVDRRNDLQQRHRYHRLLGGYHGLKDLCAAQGKRINHRRVNHSVGFKNADGETTNVVECMHHQVRRSIMNHCGNDNEKRTCRIMAACAIAQPGSDRRIVRYLRCIREIVERGFTFEDTLVQELATCGADVRYMMHVRYIYGGKTEYVLGHEILNEDEPEQVDEERASPVAADPYDSMQNLTVGMRIRDARRQTRLLSLSVVEEVAEEGDDEVTNVDETISPTLVLTPGTQPQGTLETQDSTPTQGSRAAAFDCEESDDCDEEKCEEEEEEPVFEFL